MTHLACCPLCPSYAHLKQRPRGPRSLKKDGKNTTQEIHEVSKFRIWRTMLKRGYWGCPLCFDVFTPASRLAFCDILWPLVCSCNQRNKKRATKNIGLGISCQHHLSYGTGFPSVLRLRPLQFSRPPDTRARVFLQPATQHRWTTLFFRLQRQSSMAVKVWKYGFHAWPAPLESLNDDTVARYCFVPTRYLTTILCRCKPSKFCWHKDSTSTAQVNRQLALRLRPRAFVHHVAALYCIAGKDMRNWLSKKIRLPKQEYSTIFGILHVGPGKSIAIYLYIYPSFHPSIASISLYMLIYLLVWLSIYLLYVFRLLLVCACISLVSRFFTYQYLFDYLPIGAFVHNLLVFNQEAGSSWVRIWYNYI